MAHTDQHLQCAADLYAGWTPTLLIAVETRLRLPDVLRFIGKYRNIVRSLSEQANLACVVDSLQRPALSAHFQDFLHSGLGLTHYGLIAIPGGVGLLSPSETSDALRNQGGAWFDFMAS